MSGLKTLSSSFSVKETIDRITEIAQSNYLTVFARINHAANAEQIGLHLRPTELIIFGNPKAGTLLMQDKQISGLDLPLKALAWEDENGTVWLTYNEVRWIAERHNLSEKSKPTVNAIEEGLLNIFKAAVKNE